MNIDTWAVQGDVLMFDHRGVLCSAEIRTRYGDEVWILVSKVKDVYTGSRPVEFGIRHHSLNNAVNAAKDLFDDPLAWSVKDGIQYMWINLTGELITNSNEEGV